MKTDLTIYKTDATLGYKDYAYLMRLDKVSDGSYNYISLSNIDGYEEGQIVEDLHDIYIEKTDLLPINFGIHNLFLFKYFLANYP